MMGVSVFGAGAISIVWMRMEISQIAKNCAKLEDQREMVARELHELRGQRSRSLRPSTLAGMVRKTPDAGRERTVHVSEREMKKRLGELAPAGESPALVRMSNIFISFSILSCLYRCPCRFHLCGSGSVAGKRCGKIQKNCPRVRENFITTPARRGCG